MSTRQRVVVGLLAVGLVALVTAGALGGFQESRWQIIQNLSLDEDYSVSEASWERSDLNDGTPRWWASAKNRYTYELLGTPVRKASLNGELGTTEDQGFELGCRMINLIVAVGMRLEDAEEVVGVLFGVAISYPGEKYSLDTYYLDLNGIRTELVYYDHLSTFLLTVQGT